MRFITGCVDYAFAAGVTSPRGPPCAIKVNTGVWMSHLCRLNDARRMELTPCPHVQTVDGGAPKLISRKLRSADWNPRRHSGRPPLDTFVPPFKQGNFL